MVNSILFWVVAIGAVATAAFAAIATLTVVFFSEDAIAVLGVVIAFFYGDVLFHPAKIQL